MTECNGCGSCCAPVVLPFNKEEAARARNLDPVTRAWIADDLSPMSAREVKAIGEGWIFDKRKVGSLTRVNEAVLFFYRCRWFDEETRGCTNYDGRPPGCRNYPWKKGKPDPMAAIPPTCSFNADIGRPVVVSIHLIRKTDAQFPKISP
jgi:Fe-S-cluster containining protein